MTTKKPKLTQRQLLLRVARALWPIERKAWEWGFGVGRGAEEATLTARMEATEAAVNRAKAALRALRRLA